MTLEVSVLYEQYNGGRTGGNTAVGKESQFEGDKFSFRHLFSGNIKQPEGFWFLEMATRQMGRWVPVLPCF